MKKSAIAFTFALGSLQLLGCGKSVNVGDQSQFNFPKDNGSKDIPPTLLNCAADQKGQWQFTQPDEVHKRVVDLLFVADTSASMDSKRSRIADTIPAFIQRLTPDTDFRIAVMLAHGGASSHSGRLYPTLISPAVLNSATMTTSLIKSYLKKTLINVVDDVDEANGEAGMYSLMRSFEPDRLSEIQSQGFYRNDAALSVVFVTDENDICFPSEKNGYSQFPDFVPSSGGIEATAFNKYCTKPGQTASNFPDLVYSKLHSFKGSSPVTLAGITHVDPSKVPQGTGIEDSIGHGINELVNKSSSGVLIDIGESSYATGLAKLGDAVSTTLDLLTRFGLSGTRTLMPDSIWVTVDNKPVLAHYDPMTRFIEISAGDAGKSHSTIQVSACLN